MFKSGKFPEFGVLILAVPLLHSDGAIVTICIRVCKHISDKSNNRCKQLMDAAQMEFNKFEKTWHNHNKNGNVVLAAQRVFKKVYEFSLISVFFLFFFIISNFFQFSNFKFLNFNALNYFFFVFFLCTKKIVNSVC